MDQNLILEHKRLKENLASLRNLVESYDSNELHSKPAYQVHTPQLSQLGEKLGSLTGADASIHPKI